MVLLIIGMPVAFAFLSVNVLGVYLFWGGPAGLSQLVLSIRTSVSSFSLLPVPMFVLMGEVLFRSGIGLQMIGALDKWMGRIPGRLSVLAVAGGTLFASLTGVAMGSVAMLSKLLAPEMEKRGYKKAMSLGPILGSGGLAIMIPPSALAIILGTLGQFSIGRLLIGIIVPGLLMSALYAIYIIVRCKLDPCLAPSFEITPTPLSEKCILLIRHVLPLGSLIFLVTGLIFLGVASPTEAAALGALGSFVLAWLYRSLNWEVVKKSVFETLSITVMVLMIFTGSTAFSQILAFTGVIGHITELAINLPVAPIAILLLMQLLVLVMGMFIDGISIMMVTLPIFMAIVRAAGWDPVWFGAIYLLNIETGTISPPFGVVLFAMKGVAPAGTTMEDIYRAAIPFCLLNVVAMAILIAFPQIVLWLPGLMWR